MHMSPHAIRQNSMSVICITYSCQAAVNAAALLALRQGDEGGAEYCWRRNLSYNAACFPSLSFSQAMGAHLNSGPPLFTELPVHGSAVGARFTVNVLRERHAVPLQLRHPPIYR
jgi:hypothetical protein